VVVKPESTNVQPRKARLLVGPNVDSARLTARVELDIVHFTQVAHRSSIRVAEVRAMAEVNPTGHSPKWWRKHPEAAAIAAAGAERKKIEVLGSPTNTSAKFNEILGILSFALTLASWGWTVLAPDSSTWFGSTLLLIGVLSTLVAIFRVWPTGKIVRSVLVISVLGLFGTFDWFVVIKPQKGKEFKTLLVDGYNISDECSVLPGKEDMPEWMREQSNRWQTRTESAIAEKLNYRDIQMWRGSGVIGLVKDKNVNAYQCLSLGNKIMVLESIVAEHFDSKLQHVKYKGPTYWLNVEDGKVDITEALKAGAGSADVYINSNGDSKDGRAQVGGHVAQ
jgi:hypothetical protein